MSHEQDEALSFRPPQHLDLAESMLGMPAYADPAQERALHSWDLGRLDPYSLPTRASLYGRVLRVLVSPISQERSIAEDHGETGHDRRTFAGEWADSLTLGAVATLAASYQVELRPVARQLSILHHAEQYLHGTEVPPELSQYTSALVRFLQGGSTPVRYVDMFGAKRMHHARGMMVQTASADAKLQLMAHSMQVMGIGTPVGGSKPGERPLRALVVASSRERADSIRRDYDGNSVAVMTAGECVDGLRDSVGADQDFDVCFLDEPQDISRPKALLDAFAQHWQGPVIGCVSAADYELPEAIRVLLPGTGQEGEGPIVLGRRREAGTSRTEVEIPEDYVPLHLAVVGTNHTPDTARFLLARVGLGWRGRVEQVGDERTFVRYCSPDTVAYIREHPRPGPDAPTKSIIGLATALGVTQAAATRAVRHLVSTGELVLPTRVTVDGKTIQRLDSAAQEAVERHLFVTAADMTLSDIAWLAGVNIKAAQQLITPEEAAWAVHKLSRHKQRNHRESLLIWPEGAGMQIVVRLMEANGTLPECLRADSTQRMSLTSFATELKLPLSIVQTQVRALHAEGRLVLGALETPRRRYEYLDRGARMIAWRHLTQLPMSGLPVARSTDMTRADIRRLLGNTISRSDLSRLLLPGERAQASPRRPQRRDEMYHKTRPAEVWQKEEGIQIVSRLRNRHDSLPPYLFPTPVLGAAVPIQLEVARKYLNTVARPVGKLALSGKGARASVYAWDVLRTVQSRYGSKLPYDIRWERLPVGPDDTDPDKVAYARGLQYLLLPEHRLGFRPEELEQAKQMAARIQNGVA